jgi:hypothetical protein
MTQTTVKHGRLPSHVLIVVRSLVVRPLQSSMHKRQTRLTIAFLVLFRRALQSLAGRTGITDVRSIRRIIVHPLQQTYLNFGMDVAEDLVITRAGSLPMAQPSKKALIVCEEEFYCEASQYMAPERRGYCEWDRRWRCLFDIQFGNIDNHHSECLYCGLTMSTSVGRDALLASRSTAILRGGDDD